MKLIRVMMVLGIVFSMNAVNAQLPSDTLKREKIKKMPMGVISNGEEKDAENINKKAAPTSLKKGMSNNETAGENKRFCCPKGDFSAKEAGKCPLHLVPLVEEKKYVCRIHDGVVGESKAKCPWGPELLVEVSCGSDRNNKKGNKREDNDLSKR